ncbi:hypothetical protein F5887DRAFT_1283012 [Amanita rubescens]|nr:hypothetical protein F5887DRAFT_1285183 [Amanita rubescens]KAF8345037.1 hypothetical protein F5887DRAFT_1283012 [Amanita rubescens]
MSSEITIPTEVLCEIFHLLCNGPIALHDLNNESHFHEFPWAVGQVCSRWRGAFLSYTPLWTSFALRPVSSTSSTIHFVEMKRRAIIYLERSGQQPLTIAVSMPFSRAEKTFPEIVWGVLLSYLKRWKKASLMLENGAALDEFVRCGDMSILESLRIYTPASMENFNAFRVAPHLTELDLVHPKCMATWQFPWAQLTKLKITLSHKGFNGNDLWGVLFQLENIEELRITTIFHSLRPPLSIKRLPNLRLLEIYLNFALMFSWFTAPLLEHLHINGGSFSRDYQPYDRELTSLIQRSSCHIRRLTFDGCKTWEMRRVTTALASGIEELSIICSRTLDIIQDITPELDDHYIYLPKLQVLQVTCAAPNWSHMSSIVTVLDEVLTGRARGKGLSPENQDIVPLEKFTVRLNSGEALSDWVLEVMRGWPSFVQVYINGSVLERSTPSL